MKPKLEPVKIKKINEKSFEELAEKVKKILLKEKKAAQKETSELTDINRRSARYA